MPDRDVIDLIVVDLGVTVRQYISKADNVAGVRYLLRDRWSDLVQAIHGLPTDLQHPLYSGSGLLIRKVLFEIVGRDETHRRVGVVLDVFEIDARITLRHTPATYSARYSDASDGFGLREVQPGLRAAQGDVRVPP